jgi:hypothetical protein
MVIKVGGIVFVIMQKAGAGTARDWIVKIGSIWTKTQRKQFGRILIISRRTNIFFVPTFPFCVFLFQNLFFLLSKWRGKEDNP